jgi:hypothetical protein
MKAYCELVGICALAVVLMASSPLAAQTASGAASGALRDYSFTITTPTTAWTDTAIDLNTGDVVQISSGGIGCGPQAVDGDTQPHNLPLPSAPAGALIARLHAQGAVPLLVENGKDIHIAEPSHLSLGVNGGSCAGTIQAKVHVIQATAGATEAQSSGTTNDIKAKLAAAAQIWLSGQFGTGTASASTPSSTTASNPASPSSTALPAGAAAGTGSTISLKLSDATLDSALRKNIDLLPRRVRDQFNNLGDMVNFVLLGSQPQVEAALEAASWHQADTDNNKAVLNAVLETYEKKDYLAMPMSTLYLFNRVQDFGYEEAEAFSVVASRHHFRIWKAPFQWDGKDVWVGAGTHDIGFAKDKRNGKITHKIDPAVDGERDNIGLTLQQAGKAKSLSYYLPPDPVQDARNATGDAYHSDGRILVMSLQ